jgi:hypothetical protein
MEEIIGLGVAGIANMEPGPMDIDEVKRLYGDRVTIVGNIDLHFTLTKGTPEETADEVKRRVESLAPGGRYILASANSLPNYVKPANVRAMGAALLKYGIYQEEEGKRAKAPGTPPADKSLRLESAKREAKTPETQLKLNQGDPMIQSIRDAVNQLKKDEIEGLIRSALAATLTYADHQRRSISHDEVGKLAVKHICA